MQHCAFNIPPKVTIQPHSIKEVKVRFNPTKAGKFKGMVNVSSTALVTEETSWHKAESILLNGSAEIPVVDIQPQTLDFGAVGDSKSFRITNNGNSDVPLRLRIASVSILIIIHKIKVIYTQFSSFLSEFSRSSLICSKILSIETKSQKYDFFSFLACCLLKNLNDRSGSQIFPKLYY